MHDRCRDFCGLLLSSARSVGGGCASFLCEPVLCSRLAMDYPIWKYGVSLSSKRRYSFVSRDDKTKIRIYIYFSIPMDLIIE